MYQTFSLMELSQQKLYSFFLLPYDTFTNSSGLGLPSESVRFHTLLPAPLLLRTVLVLVHTSVPPSPPLITAIFIFFQARLWLLILGVCFDLFISPRCSSSRNVKIVLKSDDFVKSTLPLLPPKMTLLSLPLPLFTRVSTESGPFYN